MKRVLVNTQTNQLHDIVSIGNEFAVVDGYAWADAPDDVTHRWTYNGSSFAAPPAKSREERAKPIKETANKVIESELPIWKQLNLVTAFLSKIDSSVAGAAAAELDEIKKKWQWIDEVRTQSNQAEADNIQPDNVEWPTLKE